MSALSTLKSRGIKRKRKKSEISKRKRLIRSVEMGMKLDGKTIKVSDLKFINANGCTIHGDNNFVDGSNNKIFGHNNRVFGTYNWVKGNNTFANGNKNTMIGNNTRSSGDDCRVSGEECILNGKRLVVKGDHNTITGECAYLVGNHCTVRGAYCKARGSDNTVQGCKNIIKGDRCTVNGNENTMSLRYSSVDGEKNTVKGFCNNVQGTVLYIAPGNALNDELVEPAVTKILPEVGQCQKQHKWKSTASQLTGTDKELADSEPCEACTLCDKCKKIDPLEAALGETSIRCLVCLCNVACVLFEPCHHVGTCLTCVKKMEAAALAKDSVNGELHKIKCPTCREKVTHFTLIR